MDARAASARIASFDADALAQHVDQWLPSLLEEEAIAVLDHPFCTAVICQKIARTTRLTRLYSVRLRLVTHRATPNADALRFVNHLFWPDLVRVSTNVRTSPVVRRAAETRLKAQFEKMSTGEKVSAAKGCSRELIRVLLFDPDRRVLASLLINPRLTEDDLMRLVSSERATPAKLAMIADDPRWSLRYDIRLGLVLNPETPRAVAASQLRFLRKEDLEGVARNPRTSIYLRRCIEGLGGS